MSSRSTGLVVIALGIGAISVGLLIWSGGLSWFGRLPGDIRIETRQVHVFIPITSMPLVSLVLSLLSSLLRHML